MRLCSIVLLVDKVYKIGVSGNYARQLLNTNPQSFYFEDIFRLCLVLQKLGKSKGYSNHTSNKAVRMSKRISLGT